MHKMYTHIHFVLALRINEKMESKVPLYLAHLSMFFVYQQDTQQPAAYIKYSMLRLRKSQEETEISRTGKRLFTRCKYGFKKQTRFQ